VREGRDEEKGGRKGAENKRGRSRERPEEGGRGARTKEENEEDNLGCKMPNIFKLSRLYI